jgi:trehalose 2-sulfotransferase
MLEINLRKALHEPGDRCGGGGLRSDQYGAGPRLWNDFLIPRSGSTWLTELATNTGALGVPHEWFNDNWIYTDEPVLGCLPSRLRGIAEVNEYVDAIVDEGQGIAGLQLSVFQAAMLQEMIDSPFDPRWLKACFYLRRRDLAAQAVSLYRSVVSGRFHSYQSTQQHIQAFKAVEYDHDNIIKWLHFIIDCEQQFSQLFRSCRIRPISLFYEDLLVDPLCTYLWI